MMRLPHRGSLRGIALAVAVATLLICALAPGLSAYAETEYDPMNTIRTDEDWSCLDNVTAGVVTGQINDQFLTTINPSVKIKYYNTTSDVGLALAQLQTKLRRIRSRKAWSTRPVPRTARVAGW